MLTNPSIPFITFTSTYHRLTPIYHSVLNVKAMKALVGSFIQEKTLVGAFSVIVISSRTLRSAGSCVSAKAGAPVLIIPWAGVAGAGWAQCRVTQPGPATLLPAAITTITHRSYTPLNTYTHVTHSAVTCQPRYK